MIRLTSDIWVSAYLTRLRLADIPRCNGGGGFG
jgi:hypothetical protein